MTTQELVERLEDLAEVMQEGQPSQLYIDDLRAAASRLSEMHEALRLIANATHPRFRAEDDIDLLYANEKAFGKCIDIARAALEHQQQQKGEKL